jgi:hypothetical protein
MSHTSERVSELQPLEVVGGGASSMTVNLPPMPLTITVTVSELCHPRGW